MLDLTLRSTVQVDDVRKGMAVNSQVCVVTKRNKTTIRSNK